MQTVFKSSFILAFGWLIIVTVLLCLPGKELPSFNWLNKIWLDKWVHIGLFMVLVILWNRAFSNKNFNREKLIRAFLWIAIWGLVFGILMEIVQHFYIPFRAFETGDIIADAVGCFAGFFISVRGYKKIDPSRNWGRNQN